MKHWYLLGLFLLCVGLCAEPVIGHAERVLFDRMMESNGIDSTSVNFLKDWSSETQLKLPLVVDILNHPWHYADYVAGVDTLIVQRNPLKIIDSFDNDLFGQHTAAFDRDYPTLFRVTVHHPKDIFEFVSVVFKDASDQRAQAFRNLTAADKVQLQFLMFSLWTESEDNDRYKTWRKQAGITEPDSLSLKKLAQVIQKIDFGALMQSAAILQTGMETIRDLWPTLRFDIKHPIEKKTPWGLMCIGSNGDDLYTQRYTFVLDPAGDDVYRGVWSTDFDHPCYMLLDFSGNDLYENDAICGLFSAFAGVGVNWDGAGNDTYRGGDYAQSAFIGYQCSIDDAGEDTYRAGTYGLAAGTLGLSLLIDGAGNDEYNLYEYGEGFGGTLGAGILADYTGYDLYYAGGKYMHVPLAPNDYRSMAQGFGFGMRPDWGGGIGVLFDNEGNDTYKGGVYSQAVAYWYALGIIIDRAGNDVYDAVYYPQGSGIHLAGGFLFDRSGDDHYYSKNGPGQGAAHDWAVGFLVDRAGDDIYSVPGGNGLGLTNSVAMFLDRSGDDRYERSCPSNYGMANQSRSSGGIGLFLDMGGHDRYATPDDTTKAVDFWRDNHSWKNDTYGFGLDTLAVSLPKTMDQLVEAAAADVDSTAAIDSLFAIAASWGVGSYTERVNKAQRYLLHRPAEAAKYIYDKQLGSDDGLTWRAIVDFATKSDSLQRYYSLALHHPDSLWNKGMISLIAELSDTTYIDTLTTVFLAHHRYVPAILGALGSMKTDRCTAILEQYIDTPSERYRVIVARGLKYINTPRARQDLLRMKDDPSFTIRTMVKLSKIE